MSLCLFPSCRWYSVLSRSRRFRLRQKRLLRTRSRLSFLEKLEDRQTAGAALPLPFSMLADVINQKSSLPYSPDSPVKRTPRPDWSSLPANRFERPLGGSLWARSGFSNPAADYGLYINRLNELNQQRGGISGTPTSSLSNRIDGHPLGATLEDLTPGESKPSVGFVAEGPVANGGSGDGSGSISSALASSEPAAHGDVPARDMSSPQGSDGGGGGNSGAGDDRQTESPSATSPIASITTESPASAASSSLPKDGSNSADTATAAINSRQFDIQKLGVETTGGKNAPVILLANQLSNRGSGVIFVSGVSPQAQISTNSNIEIFAKEDISIRSLGLLSSKETVDGTFQGVVNGQLKPGAQLFAKPAGANSLDDVSSAFAVSKPDSNASNQAVDLDLDGISGVFESLAINGDGNKDGVPDEQQANVVTLPDSRYGNVYTLSTSAGIFEAVEVVAPETAEERVLLPAGSFGFTVSNVPVGSSTIVDMILPDGQQPDVYWKQDSASNTLQRFDFNGNTGAVFQPGRVLLYLQDGGRGDADGIANGQIVDPGGPGTAPFSLNSIPYTSWAFSESGGQSPGSGSFSTTKKLTEGNSFQSQIQYAWTIPANVNAVSFQYEVGFDRDSSFVNDAFEAAFVNATGQSLVPTFTAGRDSFFNLTEGQSIAKGLGTISTSSTVGNVTTGTVTLDLSAFPAGVSGNLIFRMVNNDNQSGNDNSSYFQLTVTNSAPVAVPDTATAVEAGGVANGTAGTNPTGNVLANDTDIDAGDTKSVVGVAVGVVSSALGNVATNLNGTYGTISVAANGAFAYTVNNSSSAVQALRTTADTLADVFTYTMTDTAGLTSTAQITVTIHGANDAPVAFNDTYSTNEDIALTALTTAPGVKANDSDVDTAMSVVNATTVTNPTKGNVAMNTNGTFSYVPNLNANGQDTFTYRLNDGSLNSNIATVTVNIAPVNDPPSSEDFDFTAAEDTNPSMQISDFPFSDAEGNSLAAIIVGVLPPVGQLLLYGEPVTAGQEIAAGDIKELSLSLPPNYNGSIRGARFAVKDDGGTANGGIDTSNSGNKLGFVITPVNDAPTISNGITVTLATTGADNPSSGTLSSVILTGSSYSDVDIGALSGIAVTGTVGIGAWQYSINGTTWTNFGAVSNTNALLLTSSTQVRFTPADPNGQTASIAYRAWDQTSGVASTDGTPSHLSAAISGTTSAFSSASSTASLTVTSSTIPVGPVNDAPIINPVTTPLPTTTEDSNSIGISVSGTLTAVSYSDPNANALSGIAVTGVVGQGTWQYSTSGTTWTNFGTVSNTSSLLLTSTSQIRYVPDQRNGETPRLTFRAWDRTSGAASVDLTPGYASTSDNGGRTAFSASVATATMVVTSVNDAPTITNAATVTLTSTNEESISTATLASTILSSSGYADVDTSAANGLAITSVVGDGTWQYSTDGVTWTPFGSIVGPNALLITSSSRVRFSPAGQTGQTASFTYRAWDQTTGTASTNTVPFYANTASTGATTAFSASLATAALLVASVNDVPTISAITTSFTPTDENTASAGKLVSALLTAVSYADPDPTPASGIAVTEAIGRGFWQYSTNGTTWTNFGTVLPASSLLLTSSTQVRYLPDSKNGEMATIKFRAWDQTSGTASVNGTPAYGDSGGTTAYSAAVATATISVSSVNDAPTITNGVTVSAGATTTAAPSAGFLASSILASSSYADVDTSPVSGLAITAVVGTGTWQYSTDNVTWASFGTIATNSALLLTSTTRVRFSPTGTASQTASFTYRAWDRTSGAASTNTAPSYVGISETGGATAYSTSLATATVTVTTANIAPTINPVTTPLATTTEDAISSGTIISTILAAVGYADGNLGALSGIAVTGTIGAGSWQYSTNGTTWSSFGAVTPTSALLLKSSTLVRYSPDTRNGETSSISFRAWDQTTGTEGTKVSTSANGGTTAFSIAIATASMLVSSVNDAPTITASVALGTTTIGVASAGVLASTILSGSNYADVDTGAISGLAIRTVVGVGTWQYSTDGVTWTEFGAVTATNSLLITSTTRVRFNPSGTAAQTASFTYRAWDQTTGTASTNAVPAYATTATFGGTTAFSSAASTASLLVTLVNNAPTINAVTTSLGSTTEDANSSPTVVSAILAGVAYADPNPSALSGIAVTGVSAKELGSIRQMERRGRVSVQFQPVVLCF